MIRIEGLTKYYGAFCALKELDLEIDKGQVFGYIGPNGAGKTTTIRILAGLMKPTRGRAYIDDVDVTRHPERTKEMIGYLPDFFGIYEGMRVCEYLDFFGAAFRIPRRLRRKRIEQVLEITGSEYMRDMFVEALSRGMKQRVGIARTLVHDPSVLLLDEPLSGLDPTARIDVKALLRRLSEMGKTILVSSHILPELSAISDTVGILDAGVLQAFGPVQKIIHSIRQTRLVEVRVLDDAGGAEEVLRKADDGDHITNVKRAGDTIRFEWTASDAELSELLALLVEKGFKVAGFQEVPISLEETFMALTGKRD